MNETQRELVFRISIFVVIPTGIYFLDMTYFECLLLLGLMALVNKQTDIQDTIARLK